MVRIPPLGRRQRAWVVGVVLVALIAVFVPLSRWLLPSRHAAAGILYPRDGYFKGYSIFDGTMVEMPYPAIERAAGQGAAVLMPVDVIEEHGPHLSLGADIYISTYLARTALVDLEKKGVHALIAPPYYWGINSTTGDFPGSFNVRGTTLVAVFSDLIASMSRWGFKRFYVISCHGDADHRSYLAAAVEAARKASGVRITQISPLPTTDWPDDIPMDIHAGAFETSVMAAIYPGEVNGPLARTLQAESGFTPRGYNGDPAQYSTEGVRRYLEAAGQSVADQVAEAESPPR